MLAPRCVVAVDVAELVSVEVIDDVAELVNVDVAVDVTVVDDVVAVEVAEEVAVELAEDVALDVCVELGDERTPLANSPRSCASKASLISAAES
jgi:hypothetical protein